jgi:HEAT repeat protein
MKLIESLPAIVVSLFIGAASWAADAKPVEILLSRLKTESSYDRETTAIALHRLGDKIACEHLKWLLNDDDKSVRAAAAVSLLWLGDSSEPVRVALDAALRDKEGFPSVSHGISFRISENGMPSTAVPVLRKLLSSDDATVRGNAANLLSQFPEQAKESLPVLLAMIRRSSPAEIHKWNFEIAGAMEAIRAIGPPAGAAIPDLEQWMSSKDRMVSLEAAEAILAIAPQHQKAFEQVFEFLNAKTGIQNSVLTSARANRSIGFRLLPRVLQMMTDPTTDVHFRHGIAEFLATLGADGRVAITTLRACLRDDDPLLRIKSAVALVRIDKSQWQNVVGTFRNALSSDAYDVASNAFRFLEECPPPDTETQKALTGCLSGKSSVHACQAAVALLRINPKNDDALKCLRRLLVAGASGHQDVDFDEKMEALGYDRKMLGQAAAADAAASLGAIALPLRPELIRLLQSPDRIVVLAAARAIRQLDAK